MIDSLRKFVFSKPRAHAFTFQNRHEHYKLAGSLLSIVKGEIEILGLLIIYAVGHGYSRT
jgi:hypothetical protein